MRNSEIEMFLLSRLRRGWSHAKKWIREIPGWARIFSQLPDWRDWINRDWPKRDQLEAFLIYHSDLPRQGSDQWLASKFGTRDRPPVIGGSEMKMLDHPRSLVESKLGLRRFAANEHMNWGVTFEPVIAAITDYLLNAESAETGAIPGLRNSQGQIIQAYSPDRLLITDRSRIDWLLRDPINRASRDFLVAWDSYCSRRIGTEDLVLCEFKCPSVRIPNGKIPDEYKLQAPTGLATIPIADVALFINAAIRRCNFADFGFGPNYDSSNFHFRDQKNGRLPDFTGAPSVIGVLGISTSNPSDFIGDLGIIEASDFRILLSNVAGRRYSLGWAGDYIEMISSADSVDPQKWLSDATAEFRVFCSARGMSAIGIIPWKLMRLDVTPVFPDGELLDRFRPEIETIADLVMEMRKLELSGSLLEAELDRQFESQKKKSVDGYANSEFADA